ncbi:MAG: hypothetical protein R3A45_02955 [Bdellovibrionota bacterium]
MMQIFMMSPSPSHYQSTMAHSDDDFDLLPIRTVTALVVLMMIVQGFTVTESGGSKACKMPAALTLYSCIRCAAIQM